MGYFSSMMSDGRSKHPIPAERLFQAALKAAADCRYAVLNADPAALYIQMQTPNRERHWNGQLSVIITAQGNNSIATVSGPLQQGLLSSSSSAGAMALARGKFDAALKRSAARTPSGTSDSRPSPQPAPAAVVPESPLIADQLEKLAALWKSGALTEAEFETAKRRVLGG